MNIYDQLIKISLGTDFKMFYPTVIPFSKLFEIVQSNAMYSASTFENNIRKLKNYTGEEHILVFDFDNGFSQKYWDIFMPYVGFAAPTKSYMIDKGKGAQERYRVILLLDSPMKVSTYQHKRVYRNIINELNIDADRSCVDATRFFYGSNRKDVPLVFFRGEKYFNWKHYDNDGIRFIDMKTQVYVDIEPYKDLDVSFIDNMHQSVRYECPICAMQGLDPRKHHLGLEKDRHIITCFYDETHSQILRQLYSNKYKDRMEEIASMGKQRCNDSDIPVIKRYPHPTNYADDTLQKYDAALSVLEQSNIIYLDIETFSENKIQYSMEETASRLNNLGYVNAAYKRVEKALSEVALDPLLNRIRLITLGNGEFACPFDIYYATSEQLGRILNCIKKSFVVGQNLKFDLRSIAAKFSEQYLPTYCFDTMICAQLMHAAVDYERNAMGYSLGALAKYWLGIEMKKDQGASDWGQDNLTNEQIRYAGEDVQILPALFNKFITEVIPARYGSSFDYTKYDIKELEFLGPLVNVHPVIAIEMQFVLELVRVENNGIIPYTKYMEENRTKYLQELEDITLDLGINVKSAPQCVKFLQERVDPNCTSSSKEALSNYKDNPLVQKIQKGKSLSTRAGLMASMCDVHPYDNKLHTQFTQVLSTGRMASKHPNMQQIPRTLKEYIYQSEQGKTIFSADYPAIELRLMAAYSQDPVMLSAYRNEEDLHYAMASKIYNKPIPHTPEEKADPNFVTKNERLSGKCCNFSLIYGAMPPTLIAYFKMYGVTISMEEAELFRNKFMELYPNIASLVDNTYKMFFNGTEKEKEVICADGRVFTKQVSFYTKVQSLLGRVLAADSPNKTLNFPIQSSGADTFKLSNCKIGYESRRLGIPIDRINMVHDDTIAESSNENFEKAREIFINSINWAADYVMQRMFKTDVTDSFEIMSKDGICMKEQEDLQNDAKEVEIEPEIDEEELEVSCV